MSMLLVLTVGQTDVQLVEGGKRRELAKKNCASLHDEIERRAGKWQLVDSPAQKSGLESESLPEGEFSLCTPKLDAVLQYLAENNVVATAALILETRRDATAASCDPRFAGSILESRLRGKGLNNVHKVAYLTGQERLDDCNDLRDAIVRREIVRRIDSAIRNCIETIKPERVIVSATGGIPVIGTLVEEIVRLLVALGVQVELLEVPDGTKANSPAADRAVSRHRVPEPAISYQARRHALELIGRGNLLGAWGAVQHLHEDEVERRWTRVVEWLAAFAASLPFPGDCDIDVLKHNQMAVRAAIRVELALRAGDIPRAVHGTVAFFESALWDHLAPCLTPLEIPNKRRLYKVNPYPDDNLVRKGDGSSDDRRRPFEVLELIDDVRWYKVLDDDICGIRLAKHYLRQKHLTELGQAVSEIRELRNDVAHNEPTPQLMDDARRRMVEAHLWSDNGSFLTQALVGNVLDELGVKDSGNLCESLLAVVREKLLAEV